MVCIDCRFPKQTDAVTISKKGQNTSQVIPTAFQMAETENRNKIMVYQCEKVHFQSCGPEVTNFGKSQRRLGTVSRQSAKKGAVQNAW